MRRDTEQTGDPLGYTTSRVQEVPLLLREDYRDYLMTDDYNAVATQDSTRLADIGLGH